MQLYSHDFGEPARGFETSLNQWLWPRLLPGLLDNDPRAAFIGSGTCLDDHLAEQTPHAEDRLIFGAGASDQGGNYRLSPCDRVYCVRGPLTAQALSMPPTAAISDSAVLVRRVFESPVQKHCPVAFMPHAEQGGAGRAWESVCIELGIGYLDPCWPAERLLNGIAHSEVLLTETLHGAIVADALRIPWIAVATHAHLSTFAWRDWCASVGVTYAPVPVLSLWNSPQAGGLRALRDRARRLTALDQMAELIRVARPTLSRDEDLEQVTVGLEKHLALLERDIKMGEFAASSISFLTPKAARSFSSL